MSKFGIYLVGYIIFVAGIGLGLHLVGIPPLWIGVAVLVLVGLGIFMGANTTKRDDASPSAR